MGFKTSNSLNSQAERLFHRKNSSPFYVKKGKKSYLYDFDQNKFIDFDLNRGSLILGHAHPKTTKAVKNGVTKGYLYSQPTVLEHRLAKLVQECYPVIETIRFFPSKAQLIQEAVQICKNDSAKSKILFIGEAYQDYSSSNVIVQARFDIEEIEKSLSLNKEIGAVCLEPLSSMSNFQIHSEDYWKGLQKLFSQRSILFVLDEEITGFRLALGGGTEYFGLKPDLIFLGSVIGGGFPLYAMGGKKELFQELSPTGGIYYPLSYLAGIETIKYLRNKNPYPNFTYFTKMICSEIQSDKAKAQGLVSIFSIQTSEGLDLTNQLLDNHLYLSSSCCHFLASCHEEHEINKLIRFFQKI